jgi:hypothetical protein
LPQAADTIQAGHSNWLLVDKWHFCELQVDHEAEPPVSLKKQSRFSSGHYFAKDGDVAESQLRD